MLLSQPFSQGTHFSIQETDKLLAKSGNSFLYEGGEEKLYDVAKIAVFNLKWMIEGESIINSMEKIKVGF